MPIPMILPILCYIYLLARFVAKMTTTIEAEYLPGSDLLGTTTRLLQQECADHDTRVQVYFTPITTLPLRTG